MIPWRFLPTPMPDELLSSFLLRAAKMHGAIPHTFCSIHFPGHAIWNRDIDRNPDRILLENIMEVSKQNFDVIEAMTFRKHSQLFGGSPGVVPWVLPVGVWHRKRKDHGLQFCPLCLREGMMYYVRSWRMAFTTRCAKHKILLLDACNQCDAPLAPHRSPSGLMLHCHVCNRALSSAPEIKLIPTGINQLEDLLMKACAGETVVWGDKETISAGDWLVGCRYLLTIAISRIHEGDLNRTFECSRIGNRVNALSALETLLQDWPAEFLKISELQGVTRQTFSRCANIPIWLHKQITKLPCGYSRQRSRRSPPFGLQTIRRAQGNWRQRRAAMILAHLGWS